MLVQVSDTEIISTSKIVGAHTTGRDGSFAVELQLSSKGYLLVFWPHSEVLWERLKQEANRE